MEMPPIMLREPARLPPLAALEGLAPEAPAWFSRAVGQIPEREFVDIDGTRIEMLCWGKVGRPGLLFLHGNGANAEWWRFIAPFFAGTHRVAAFSLSGMGLSSWRPVYSSADFRAEAMAVAQAARLFDGPSPPIVIGHSLGAAVMVLLLARSDQRFAGGVAIDSHVDRAGRQWGLGRATPETRFSRSSVELLARYRFVPPQPSFHLFITDFIARSSIRYVEGGGWTWKHDPAIVGRFDFEDMWLALPELTCPLMLIRGALSDLTSEEQIQAMRRQAGSGTIAVTIPEAHHHVMVSQPIALIATLRTAIANWQ